MHVAKKCAAVLDNDVHLKARRLNSFQRDALLSGGDALRPALLA